MLLTICRCKELSGWRVLGWSDDKSLGLGTDLLHGSYRSAPHSDEDLQNGTDSTCPDYPPKLPRGSGARVLKQDDNERKMPRVCKELVSPIFLFGDDSDNSTVW